MYTTQNFKTKKALKEAVAAWVEYDKEGSCYPPEDNAKPVTLFAPGLGSPKRDGWETVEGPHYPAPHTWYAQVLMQNGMAVKVK